MSKVVYKSLAFLGYPNYRVGDDGTVWSKARHGQWKQLKPRPDTKNHLMVFLSHAGVGRNRYVHHLVLEAFVGFRPAKMEACHDPDRNPHNNHLNNLRWDSHKANIHDSMRHGTRVCNKGERNPSCKLSWSKVHTMRRQRVCGWTYYELMGEYGVSYATVRSICTHRTWKV